MAHDSQSDARYEVQDAHVREIVFAGVGLAIGTMIVFLLVWGLFNLLKKNYAESQTPNPMGTYSQLPPDPRLQVQPWLELQNLRRHEDEVLKTYGWVDKSGGKVRLPIDRAMDIVAQRGLPVRGGTSAPAR